MMKGKKPLVVRLLEGKKVPYELFEYEVGITDAEAVAHSLGVPSGQLFKTLVAYEQPDKRYLVMLPANQQLDLKKLARVVGVKKMKLATHQEAEAFTGLQVGGISALALLNRGFRVYLDEQARQLEAVVVSAGMRGANVRLGVGDLQKLTKARWADVATTVSVQ